MADRTVSMFEGKDADECEAFIVEVTQKMFAEGKDTDDGYIARYAATRMSKRALRWFIVQPKDVQTNWSLLRQALVAHYDQLEESCIPTPAEAPEIDAAPPVTQRKIATLGSPGRGKLGRKRPRLGIMEFLSGWNSLWLGQKMEVDENGDEGYFLLTKVRGEALRLELETHENGKQRLRLHNHTWDYLGFAATKDASGESFRAAALCGISNTGSGTATSFRSSITPFETFIDGWKIDAYGDITMIPDVKTKVALRIHPTGQEGTPVLLPDRPLITYLLGRAQYFPHARAWFVDEKASP